MAKHFRACLNNQNTSQHHKHISFSTGHQASYKWERSWSVCCLCCFADWAKLWELWTVGKICFQSHYCLFLWKLAKEYSRSLTCTLELLHWKVQKHTHACMHAHTQTLCVKTSSCCYGASIEALFVLLVSTAIFHHQHPHHIICHRTAKPSSRHQPSKFKDLNSNQVYAVLH